MVASADTQVEPRTPASSYCPRVDPKLSRRFPSAQTLDLNCVTFYSGATRLAGRFSEGFLLRRLS
jgi:hypothetical protein